MNMQEIQDRMEIRELTDVFANLADTKEVEKQVELFMEDGLLEFQMGFDGEINEIRGIRTARQLHISRRLRDDARGTVPLRRDHISGVQERDGDSLRHNERHFAGKRRSSYVHGQR